VLAQSERSSEQPEVQDPTDPAGAADVARGFPLAELVERTGVPASTIHHYRRAGLLPAPLAGNCQHFLYDEHHVEAIRGVRLIRDRLGVPLDRVAELLPGLLATGGDALSGDEWSENAARQLPAALSTSRRLIDASIELFRSQGYSAVSVSEIAEAAGLAKGSVYRYFPSKEAIFTRAVETVAADLATTFAAAVEDMGGRHNFDPEGARAGEVFAKLVWPAMPILLELGARAAQGHATAIELAQRVLRLLAEAAGRPLADDPLDAGITVLLSAMAGTMRSAIRVDPTSLRDTSLPSD
jgi:AcrR family transcriptional regulator